MKVREKHFQKKKRETFDKIKLASVAFTFREKQIL